MPRFVKFPNLPSRQVTLAAAGAEYAGEMETALSPFGIRVLSCPNNPLVDERLKSHIDLSVFHLGGASFVMSPSAFESNFAYKLKKIGAVIEGSESKFSPEYPNDASLCAFSLGEKLFHNTKICDKLISGIYKDQMIHVSQGYAKCAVSAVSENVAITSDAGVAQVMRQHGIEVLEITPGYIELCGFETGFIGGASFKLAPDIMAFTGTMKDHPDKSTIEYFLRLHGITPVYLTDKPIFDIGSLIPIQEN